MLLSGSEKRTVGSYDEGPDSSVPAAITDTGCERDLNEDRYAVVECSSGLAWVVCDGMGGSTGGELAAQLAIDAIRRDLENLPARPPEQALRESIQEANRVIVLRRQNPAFREMGTTIVGVFFQGPQIVVGHAGDSRAYLVRDGAIQQLTVDHTYVQELVDRGEVRPEEALSHHQAHILTRCLGAEPALNLDTTRFWLSDAPDGERPDLLVLCTDGLYSLVTEAEIATAVSQESPQSACSKLVELAKSRGGYDNITLAVIPLAGQLRTEPPEGFDEEAVLRQLRDSDAQPASDGIGWIRTLILLFMVSGLAVLLVVLFMAVMLMK